MTLSNISLLNSFTDQFVRLNQIVVIINNLLAGQSTFDGTITLTNSTGLGNNITLNISNGMIQADGGLISNLNPSFLTSNSISFVSNSTLLNVSPQAHLGGTITFNINSANGVNDTSVSNVTTANLTNLVYKTATGAFDAANAASVLGAAAFNQSNNGIGVLGTAQSAYAQANTANTLAIAAFTQANVSIAAFSKANTASNTAVAAFAQANTANTLAIAAFGQANTATTNASNASNTAVAAFGTANGSAQYNSVGTFTKGQAVKMVTLTDAATIAVDMSLGNQFNVTLGANRTLGAPTNLSPGQIGSIEIKQDGTGSRTLSYNSIWKFPGGVAPTLSTGANAVDRLDYLVANTSFIHAAASYNIS